jgi:hypothetical protein
MPATIFGTRKGPLVIALGILGGLLYTTYGGRQEPRPRATTTMHDARGATAPVSETLQSVAGTGGERTRSRDSAEDMDALRQHDPKDTRLYSADPSAYSKRNPDKVRSDLEGGHGTSVGSAQGGGQGKNVGERDTEKSGDLAWKKIGS